MCGTASYAENSIQAETELNQGLEYYSRREIPLSNRPPTSRSPAGLHECPSAHLLRQALFYDKQWKAAIAEFEMAGKLNERQRP